MYTNSLPIAEIAEPLSIEEIDSLLQKFDGKPLRDRIWASLQKMHEDAYQEGIEYGYEEAYDEGYARGSNEAYHRGLGDGYDQGYAKGLMERYNHV